MSVENVEGNRVKAAKCERMRNGVKPAEEVGRKRCAAEIEEGARGG